MVEVREKVEADKSEVEEGMTVEKVEVDILEAQVLDK